MGEKRTTGSREMTARKLNILACLIVVPVALSACSEHTDVTSSLIHGIDKTSGKLKQSVKQMDLDRHIAELHRSAGDARLDLAKNAKIRKFGQQTKEALDKMSHSLGDWLKEHPAADNTAK